MVNKHLLTKALSKKTLNKKPWTKSAEKIWEMGLKNKSENKAPEKKNTQQKMQINACFCCPAVVGTDED